MEVVENLPKRVVQPYRSMSIHQLIACDDVPPDEMVGVEAIHKHLKITVQDLSQRKQGHFDQVAN